MGTCSTCSQPHSQCGCNKTKTDSMSYSGPNLPCTNVDTNDDVTLVIQKLNDAICNIVPPTTTSSSSTTTTTITTLAFHYLVGYLDASTGTPVLTTVFSDIGGSIFFSYGGAGNYTMIFSNPIYPLDNPSKVWVSIGQSTLGDFGRIIAYPSGLNNINIATQDPDGNPVDGVLLFTPIEIRTYLPFSTAQSFSVAAPSAVASCPLPKNTILYSKDSVLNPGVIIYTDAALTIPFVGALAWYSHSPGFTTYQIDDTGTIIGEDLIC